MGNGPPAAVLADERAVLVELDVHAVSIFGQRVVAAQLAFPAQRRLAVGALLVSITEGQQKEENISNYSEVCFIKAGVQNIQIMLES